MTNDSPVQQSSPSSLKRGRREICNRCRRPKPRACLCHALPDQSLELHDTSIVILQHPHEFRHKNNRSVPLLELCFSTPPLHLCVGRRFGDQIPVPIRDLMMQPLNLPILIFPDTRTKQEVQAQEQTQPDGAPPVQVHSLLEIRQKIAEWRKQQQQQQQQQKQQHVDDDTADADSNINADLKPRVVLLVLDATWKYAKEMHQSNRDVYPSHMLRMALQGDKDLPDNFQPRRFEIRTTPSSEDHSTVAWMCTAECVAWIASQLEQESQPQNQIYETVLRVIDAVMEQHNSFVGNNKRIRKNIRGIQDDLVSCGTPVTDDPHRPTDYR